MGNYGPFVTEEDVIAAGRATTQRWINAYTADVGRQRSITLPPVRKYGINLAVNENGIITPDPNNEYPAMAFSSPGLYAEPERHGNGAYEAPFALGAAVVVSAADKDSALELAALYGSAVTLMFVQQGSLGGFAVETTWQDRETILIGYELDRAIAHSVNVFIVRVGGVASRFGGPVTPPVDPAQAPPDPSTVTHVDITATRTP